MFQIIKNHNTSDNKFIYLRILLRFPVKNFSIYFWDLLGRMFIKGLLNFFLWWFWIYKKWMGLPALFEIVALFENNVKISKKLWHYFKNLIGKNFLQGNNFRTTCPKTCILLEYVEDIHFQRSRSISRIFGKEYFFQNFIKIFCLQNVY